MLDSPQAIRRAAMDLLARREHGWVELARKLTRRGADSQQLEFELQRLADEGLLSESRYLESFIASRARGGYGPLRIREELTRRGLARADVEQALAASGFDWSEQLHELWVRRFGELPVDAGARARQMRFLLYRGFSADLVGRLLSGRRLD